MARGHAHDERLRPVLTTSYMTQATHANATGTLQAKMRKHYVHRGPPSGWSTVCSGFVAGLAASMCASEGCDSSAPASFGSCSASPVPSVPASGPCPHRCSPSAAKEAALLLLLPSWRRRERRLDATSAPRLVRSRTSSVTSRRNTVVSASKSRADVNRILGLDDWWQLCARLFGIAISVASASRANQAGTFE